MSVRRDLNGCVDWLDLDEYYEYWLDGECLRKFKKRKDCEAFFQKKILQLPNAMHTIFKVEAKRTCLAQTAS